MTGNKDNDIDRAPQWQSLALAVVFVLCLLVSMAIIIALVRLLMG